MRGPLACGATLGVCALLACAVAEEPKSGFAGGGSAGASWDGSGAAEWISGNAAQEARGSVAVYPHLGEEPDAGNPPRGADAEAARRGEKERAGREAPGYFPFAGSHEFIAVYPHLGEQQPVRKGAGDFSLAESLHELLLVDAVIDAWAVEHQEARTPEGAEDRGDVRPAGDDWARGRVRALAFPVLPPVPYRQDAGLTRLSRRSRFDVLPAPGRQAATGEVAVAGKIACAMCVRRCVGAGALPAPHSAR